jgi:glutaredoxin/glutathione-dependent peroxiredoxin
LFTKEEIKMTLKVGDKIPDVSVQRMGGSGPEPVSTADLFSGRKVAFFALPGAFTPTCSAKHVPGYLAHADALKGKGVDAIVCLSVNDAFVMGAWGKDQGTDNAIDMIADGSGDFTRAVGLEFDASKFGMGARSQRYSMIVNDGIVQELNIEAPGGFEVSTAEHMLGQL